MKSIYALLLAVSFIAVSCETPCDVQTDINVLRSKKENIEKQIGNLEYRLAQQQITLEDLNEKVKERGLLSSGKEPHYILKLRLKQSHFSLDIGDHVKDEMNAIEFEMPVDKRLYNSVTVGHELVDDFRVGSLIMKGSFGEWHVKVINKFIKE